MARITPYHSLAVVYTLAILAGSCEYSRGPAVSNGERDIYGDPDGNYPETMARLYRDRPESEYLLGRRLEAEASRRFNQEQLHRDPKLLEPFMAELKSTLEHAALHYERALDLGLKSEEHLYYNYALTLIRIEAEPDRIDR